MTFQTAVNGVTCPPPEVATAEARAALPPEVPLDEAVHNIAHASLLVLGLARDDFSIIGRALSDRIHQPRRERLYPRSMELVRRATELGATVSGAGPAVLFWCHWQQTGNLFDRLREEASDCDVRRVPSSPAARTCERSSFEVVDVCRLYGDECRPPRAARTRRG